MLFSIHLHQLQICKQVVCDVSELCKIISVQSQGGSQAFQVDSKQLHGLACGVKQLALP